MKDLNCISMPLLRWAGIFFLHNNGTKAISIVLRREKAEGYCCYQGSEESNFIACTFASNTEKECFNNCVEFAAN